jgi:hypothetical protein
MNKFVLWNLGLSIINLIVYLKVGTSISLLMFGFCVLTAGLVYDNTPK